MQAKHPDPGISDMLSVVVKKMSPKAVRSGSKENSVISSQFLYGYKESYSGSS